MNICGGRGTRVRVHHRFIVFRARFCEYTVANAPKIVRMRLKKLLWSHFVILLLFFLIFFLGLPLLVEKSLYRF